MDRKPHHSYLDPLDAIPVHAAIQLVSNGSRTLLHRRVIDRSVVWPYALPLVPAGFVGVALARCGAYNFLDVFD